VAAGFTHSQALRGDKLNTLQYFTILAAQHGILWVTLDLYPAIAGATGILNRLGAGLGAASPSDHETSLDSAPPVGDLETAQHLGRRVAQVTRDLFVGRHVLRTTAERNAS
jgi:NAD(P)H dehydrogenase (quinone)